MQHFPLHRMKRQLILAIAELKSEIAYIRVMQAARELRRVLLEQRYRPDQPRIPAGNPDGGQWTDDGTSDVQSRISVAIAQTLSGQPPSYNECLNLCYPLLERPGRVGSDRNYWDFQKCMNACLGRNL